MRRLTVVVVFGLTRLSPLPAGPIEEMQPRTWYEVPDSRVESVKPSPEPPSWSGFKGLFAWCGGAFDTKRDRLLIWGGGHADYTGNEVYAFNMGTLEWSRTWGPSSSIPPADGQAHETYSDGNPGARHTYDNLVYNRKRDAFFSSGGSLSWSGGWSSGTWELDLSTNTWHRRKDAKASTFTATAYDHVTGRIIRASENSTEEYNADTDTWSQRSTRGNNHQWRMTGEIDSLRRVMVFLGGGEFQVLNLETYSYSSPSPSGDTEIIDAYAPGLTWDSKSQKLVAWSGGASVYTINISENLSSYLIQKISPASANTVTPTSANSQGTYSKFQYSPKQNAFVTVNRVDENVYIYKLGEGPGTVALAVHPNPFRGAVAISLPQKSRISVFDATGRLVARFPEARRSAVWRAGGFPAGIYLLRAELGGRLLEKRIVHAR